MLLKEKIEKKTGYILWIWVFIALFTGCSTGKNSSATRAYHELTTRYNIYFNAEEAYNEILNDQAENFQENYAELLPFYPSRSDTAKSSEGGPFDPVIEKTGKAIREHSITSKPRRDPSKAQSQEYRQWLRREEFNPFLKNVWMLRGKAFLQNGDYDEALTVFSGMLHRFSHDHDLVNETEIWMLRTYTEMGRTYDAEKTAYASKNKRLPPHLKRLLTEHYTYFLLRQKEFPEAIPQLQKTISQEPDHQRKKRLQFLLGQIYAIIGDEEKAHLAFENVKGLRTPPDLGVNATRWQSAMANDSLTQVFHPSQTDNTTEGTTVTTAYTDIKNRPHRFSSERTLAENAALHRQWRTRNGLWQSTSVSSGREDKQLLTFNANKNGMHYLWLTFRPGSVDKNRLLFAIADFNFSHFKLRRFNSSFTYLPGIETLQIESFRSFEEVSRYTEMILSDSLFRSAAVGTTPILISEENMKLIQSGKEIEEYTIFYTENIISDKITFQSIIQNEPIEFEEKSRQEPEKIVSLETSSDATSSDTTSSDTTGQKEISPHSQPAYQPERITAGERMETTEALKRRLEENAAKALQQQQETAPRKNREQLLKERERQRDARIRQRERDVKDRQRKRDEALKQREKERAEKVRKK